MLELKEPITKQRATTVKRQVAIVMKELQRLNAVLAQVPMPTQDSSTVWEKTFGVLSHRKGTAMVQHIQKSRAADNKRAQSLHRLQKQTS